MSGWTGTGYGQMRSLPGAYVLDELMLGKVVSNKSSGPEFH